MKRYEIAYRAKAPKLDARDKGYWADVAAGVIDQVNWPGVHGGRRTEFRVVWCDDGLYLRYECEDKFISAEALRTNDYVWMDSCVEFFVAPNPAKPLNYYNFEMNCAGTYLMGTHCDWGEGYRDRSQEIGLTVATTVPGPVKKESLQDDGWQLVARIPWAHFERDAVHLPPKSGDVWRANFYRIGGRTEKQCATWSPITNPKPQFHLPQYFGEIVFTGGR
jgi:hypothetical protein